MLNSQLRKVSRKMPSSLGAQTSGEPNTGDCARQFLASLFTVGASLSLPCLLANCHFPVATTTFLLRGSGELGISLLPPAHFAWLAEGISCCELREAGGPAIPIPSHPTHRVWAQVCTGIDKDSHTGEMPVPPHEGCRGQDPKVKIKWREGKEEQLH